MKKNKSFTYCLNSSTIRNCGLNVEEEIKVAAKAGYAGIELWMSEIDGYLDQGGTPAKLKQMLDQNGLQMPNVIAFFQWAMPDKEIRKKELEEAKRILTLARQIDCPYVAAPPAGIVEMKGLPLEDIAEYYGDLLELARGIGVKPLLEFWGHSKVLGSLAEAMQILELVDDPDAMILGDVFHMAKTKGSFELLADLKGSELGIFHANDYPDAPDISKLSDAQRVYPCDGAAPLGQIKDTLKKIGYDGIMSLELFNKEYEKNGAEAVVKTGIEKMKAVFDE